MVYPELVDCEVNLLVYCLYLSMTDNEEGTPFFTKYAYLVPTAKALAPESEEDELSSSDEVVNKEFDKNEFLRGFQKIISEVISKLLEEPVKNHGEKQRRKNLRKKRQNTSQTIPR